MQSRVINRIIATSQSQIEMVSVTESEDSPQEESLDHQQIEIERIDPVLTDEENINTQREDRRPAEAMLTANFR